MVYWLFSKFIEVPNYNPKLQMFDLLRDADNSFVSVIDLKITFPAYLENLEKNTRVKINRWVEINYIS
jgi:hypothetical protein